MWFLALSNLNRRLPRTVLTWLGLSIAFLLFGLLRAFVEYSLGERFVAASHERLVVSPRYSPLDSLPLWYIGEIESMDGVVEVEPHQLLAGHIEGKRRFQQLVADPQKHFSIFPEYRVDDGAKAAFQADRAAALAPVELAAEFGWTSGQRIAMESPYPRRDGGRLWEFTLVGTYSAPENVPVRPMFLLRWDYFDDARTFGAGTANWLTVRVSDLNELDAIAQEIDASFANSANPTRSYPHSAAQRELARQVGDIEFVTSSIIGCAFFAVIFSTGHVVMQMLRERIREFGVLASIGFTRARIMTLLVAEVGALCFFGYVAGMGAASVILDSAGDSARGVLGDLHISASTMVLGASVAVLTLAVVVGVPCRAIGRMTVAAALRGR